MHGRIIDFEGIDGAGKSTQAALFLKFLRRNKFETVFYKFPQYTKNIYGRLVADFLVGQFGPIETISPYLASLGYALDRSTVGDKIRAESSSGKIVVFDRYVASTKAHQASRFSGKERGKLISWLDDLEYKTNKMPKEDLVFLLDMPVGKALELIDKRKKDLLEKKELLAETRAVYLQLAKHNFHWLVINCVDEKGKLLSKNEIHKQIVARLIEKGVI